MIWRPYIYHKTMETLYVIIHAILWGLMEVEMEGTRGWMYDSPTECSGILAFTWYHLIMNIIAFLTVFFILRAERNLKDIHFGVVLVYNTILWFVIEDVTWFMVNGIHYRTAPWQSTSTAVISTVAPLALLYYMDNIKVSRKKVFDYTLIPYIVYMWMAMPWARTFELEPYTPRKNYCN